MATQTILLLASLHHFQKYYAFWKVENTIDLLSARPYTLQNFPAWQVVH